MSNSLHLSLSVKLSNRPGVSVNRFLGFSTVREERSVLALISLLQSLLIRHSPTMEIPTSHFITHHTRHVQMAEFQSFNINMSIEISYDYPCDYIILLQSVYLPNTCGWKMDGR